MHVRSGLYTENLEKDVSIRGGGDNVFWRYSGKGCSWGQRRSLNGEQKRRPACLLLILGCGLNHSRRPSVAAAVLLAAGARVAMMHGATRAHVVN